MQRANVRMFCLTAESSKRWTEGPQSWRTTNFLGHLERERVGVYERAEAEEMFRVMENGDATNRPTPPPEENTMERQERGRSSTLAR